jgi:hypothetical protein
MEKAGYFGQLFRLFAAKKKFRIAVMLVIFAAIRANSAEPVLTLAMVRHNPSPEPLTAAVDDQFATSILDSSPVFTLENQNEISSEPKTARSTGFSPVAQLEKQTVAKQHCLILLAHKKLGVNKCSTRWLDIQAGYGQVCYDPVDLKMIEPDWEEPGCIYVKASFSF